MHIFYQGTTFEVHWDRRKENPGLNSWQSQNSYFCLGGDKPKVQMPYQTIPGQIPRKLVVERYVPFVCTVYDRGGPLFYFKDLAILRILPFF